MTIFRRIFLFSLPLAWACSNAQAVDLQGMMKGAATDSLKEQAIDKGVDMGANYAKKSLGAGSTPSATRIAIDAASGKSAGSIAKDAAVSSIKQQATHKAIDMGADYSKKQLKQLVK